jgi:hypothetical protein
MTIDYSRYADNVFYKHLERFRDTWLERSLRSHVRIGDLFAAYDVFCEQNNIRHRKIVTHELLPELSRIGVRLGRIRVERPGSNGKVYRDTRPAFVTWRLTRNAKYAIRDRRGISMDYLYVPLAGKCNNDDEAGDDE